MVIGIYFKKISVYLIRYTSGEKFKEAVNLYRKKVLARRGLIIPPNPTKEVPT
jgi:hypothetical protein